MILGLCFSLFAVPGTVWAAEAPALPQTSVAPGLYRAAQTVSLSCETPDAEIYYTTDNFMPDTGSARYTSPIQISETTNICAVAVKDGVQSEPVTFSYIIKGAEEPKLQFVVLSDFHIDDYASEQARVEKEFDVIHSIFPNPDAIVFAGDLINDSSYIAGRPNLKADHAVVKQLIQDNLKRLKMDTRIQMVTGNHDAGHNAMLEYYTGDAAAWFPADSNGDYALEIEGYPFVIVNSQYSASTHKTFLNNTLSKYTDTSKPIFFFMHIPMINTVGFATNKGNSGFDTLLKDYPNLLAFTGHTHFDMQDDRSIWQKDFTALNTGSSSYIESPGTFWAHTGQNYGDEVGERFEMPVTQAYFVEVFDDRVELDRVAMNADWGDVKKTSYSAAPPYHNTGVVIGEPWIVDLKADKTAMKESFRYTGSRGTAPAFAQDAKAVLETVGEEGRVTFPQAANVRKVSYYEIRTKDPAGNTAGTMKVMPENVYSPVPKTLTYPLKGEMEEGVPLTAEITAVDAFGKKSAPLAAEGTYTKPIPPAEFAYMLNETFDKALTNSSTQIIPTVDNWDGEGAAAAAEGKLEIRHTGPRNGKNKVSYQVNLPLQPGTDKTCAVIPRGKTYVSMDYELNKSGKNGLSVRVCDNMGTTGQLPFGVRVDITPAAVEAQQNNDEKWVSLGNLEGMDFTSGKIKIGVDAAEQGTTKIIGVWITPKGGTETLIPGTQNEEMGDIGTGLYKLILYPAVGVEEGYEPEAGTVVGSIDNLKVWEAAEAQAAGTPHSTVAFDTIKGKNTDPEDVTHNLALSNAKTTLNGLEIVRWESSHPNVIAADGTVTLPEENTQVTLTPIVKFPDPEKTSGQDPIETEGYPVTVLVKVAEVIVTGKTWLNETFDKALTDSSAQIIPTMDNWDGEGAAVAADGKLEIRHAGPRNGKNNVSYQVNLPLQPGTDKTCDVIPRGKTYVSLDWELNKSGKNGLGLILCDNKGSSGQKAFGVRVNLTATTAEALQNNDTKYVPLGTLENMDFTSGHLKVGLNATVSGQTKITGVWITPKGGTETLIPGTQDAEMGDIGTGLYKLILYPAVGAEAGYEPEAGTVVGSIDNLKIWEPAAVKLPQDFGWRDAYLTRDGEKVDMAAGEFVPEFVMQNGTEEAKDAVLIAAVYSNGVLSDMTSKTFTQEVPSNGTTTVQLDPITITDAASQRVVYYVWDSLTGMKPVKKTV